MNLIRRCISVITGAYYKAFTEKPQRFYMIDGFLMDMGNEHMLSITKKHHPMYDEFVPFLGKISSSVHAGGALVLF